MGYSKGFGFISYYKLEYDIILNDNLNDKDLLGKSLKINILKKIRRHEVKKNNIYVKEILKKNLSEKN